MTTELAIFNRSAVALAADSAVTVSSPFHSQKVYNTANKLFAMSKYAPVGIMVYGNATIMGVPWETLIKLYRNQLQDRKFEYLKGYYEDFIHFLEGLDFFTDKEQDYVENIIVWITYFLRKKLDKFTSENIASTEKQITDELSALIDRLNIQFKEKISQDTQKIINSKRKDLYIKIIKDNLNKIKQQIHISDKDDNLFIDLVLNGLFSGIVSNYSGIVIAGFGEKEIYPSVLDFKISAILANCCLKRDFERNDNSDGTIVPFAQKEDIRSFIEGISPNMDHLIRDTLNKVMIDLGEGLSNKIIKKLQLNDNEKQQIIIDIHNICDGTLSNLNDELVKFKQNHYIDPIINTVGFLNKEELANMAETLVSLVSFRKQVTSEAETVGGPIDVAVITKGDGLIWMKRKHYFDPKLNQHFFANYYNN